MATLTPEQVNLTGLDATQNAATGGGDEFLNNGNIILRVENGSGAPITVTVISQATISGLAVADAAVAIPAGEFRFIGPFPPSLFNDANGKAQITYSGVTSLTVEVLDI